MVTLGPTAMYMITVVDQKLNSQTHRL